MADENPFTSWHDLCTDVRDLDKGLTGVPALRYLAGAAEVRPRSAMTVGHMSGGWMSGIKRGEWTGSWTEPDGRVRIAGTYLAQWRKTDGQWLIQAELFVATQCRGPKYCSQRPQ